MKMKEIVIALLCGLLLSGCAGAGYESRSERIRSQHPDWDQATVDKLAGRSVEAGMTRDMVKAAMGNPDSVSTEGGEEVWGYAYWYTRGEEPSRQIFVYFVHFKGDKVVRTRGDTSRLQTVF